MRPLADLIAAFRTEAERAPFPIDTPVYEKAGRAPTDPILYVGGLDAPICILGRDLGKDEVAEGEPLIGAGGRLVRSGLFRAATGREPEPRDRRLAEGLRLAVMTNTVPYKPPGNKAYAPTVKDRFRPLLLEFLTDHWQGNRLITLGNEAFQWFEPYSEAGAMDLFWAREDRYTDSISCRLPASPFGRWPKTLKVEPLPHPSPLNARWFAKFPELLASRLKGPVSANS